MSQYKTHSRFNLFVALPLLIWGMIYFFRPDIESVFIFSGAFFYGTLFMSPDSDVADKVKIFSLRGILTLPFRSYSKCFSHRGISHSIPWGTFTRLLWLMLWSLPILFLLDYTISKKSFLNFLKEHQFFLFYGFLGLSCADVCHLILDYVPLKKRH